MIIYLTLLISTSEQAALSVLGLQRGGLPRFTRALSRFVTVSLISDFNRHNLRYVATSLTEGQSGLSSQ